MRVQLSYNGFPLLQDLVVLAEGGQEDEGGDVLETVNPLPPLRLLAANVHDPARTDKLTIRADSFYRCRGNSAMSSGMLVTSGLLTLR